MSNLPQGNPFQLVFVLRPRRLIEVANSVNAGIDPQIMTLSLRTTFYTAWEISGYYHHWIHDLTRHMNILNSNVPADFTTCFVSKWKLDALARKEAIKVGDILWIEFYFWHDDESGNRVTFRVEPQAQIVSFNGNFTANLRLSNPINNKTSQINECVGPKQILDECIAMMPAGDYANRKAWDDVKVRRQGRELGSLYEIRQSVHRFHIEMEAWHKR